MEKSFQLFKRLAGIPYLLALCVLFMPLATVSCSDEKIAEPTFYDMAQGVDLTKKLKAGALQFLERLENGNPKALEKFKPVAPDFPKLNSINFLYAIIGALIAAALIAWLSPLGLLSNTASLIMGLISMVALWGVFLQLEQYPTAMIPQLSQVIKVEAGPGLYGASALILISTAMHLAIIIRTIRKK